MDREKWEKEEEWRYTAHSIVKYKPELYNEEGHYTPNEWVGMDDVGHICDGHLVTIDEYLETEQKYVDAVIKVMELTNCKYLTVSYLGDTIWDTKYSIRQMQSKKNRFLQYDRVLYDDLKNKLEIHFGGEFYMYFNTKMSIDILREEIHKIGLYLDPR